MTNKEYLISKLESMLSEEAYDPETIPPTIQFLRDDETEYNLIHEYNPTFTDVLQGKYKSPFLVYECTDGERFCVTVSQPGSKPTFNVVDIITEKEEHERFNAVGIHVQATLMGINQNEAIDAKIDTGAECCSLGVEDIHITKSELDPEAQKVKFSYNERQYTMNVEEMISVSSADGGIHYRPTVLFDVKINGHLVPEVQVNLNDRSHMEYKFLVGMNLLEKCDLVIDPSITKEDIQLIHNMLNEGPGVITTDPDNITEVEDDKPLATRQIMELMLAYPGVSFKDIISMSKLDAMNALDNLQA